MDSILSHFNPDLHIYTLGLILQLLKCGQTGSGNTFMVSNKEHSHYFSSIIFVKHRINLLTG
jgi:hypothetical protein